MIAISKRTEQVGQAGEIKFSEDKNLRAELGGEVGPARGFNYSTMSHNRPIGLLLPNAIKS